MNLLSVIHYPTFGGPSNEALRLREARAKRGWQTLVLLPDEPGSAAERLRAGGVEVVQMPLHRLRARRDPRLHAGFGLAFLPEVLRIRRMIRERRIDLALIGGLINPHAAVAARLAGVPVVWQILDSRTPRPLRAALMPLVTRLADAALFTGNALIELHMGSEPPAIPCLTYFAPVDTMHFRPSVERRAATRARLGIPSDAPVVGIVANLNPQKGIEYFVRAAAEIYQELPDSFFLLVGPRHETHRDYAALLDAEVRRSGVPVERFIFTGDRADVENYYPAMDLKLVTSLPQSEGTTTAAMEALACGVPVITTDVGAQREVVEDGVTGCVVPPLAPARIAEAALRLLVDPALLARMGAAARRQAVARFDVEVCADAHVRAFDVALAHHREKPPAGTDGVSPARRAAAGETPSVPGSSSLAAPSSAEGRRAETVSAPNAPSARGELVRADGSADRGSG